MKACTSEKRDLSFRARPSPNPQDLDESVGKLVYKLNNWKHYLDSQLDFDDGNRSF